MRRRAFTLIEMMTTVAVLIIVLGLMVSLAREVRYRSAEQLTKDLLRRLAELTRSYQQHNQGKLPSPPAILEPEDLKGDEVKVRSAARTNSTRLVEALRREIARSGLLEPDPSKGGVELPLSLYDGRMLADAWGNPIVFMAKQHPAIGMAPVGSDGEEAAFFFFSAGPDGRYLTRDDNLYSYEGSVER